MINQQQKNSIMEREKVEEALYQMEAKYRSMFENAVSGIFQTTPDGHYLDANPALARLYGYSSPHAMISSLTDISNQLYVDSKRRDEFIAALQEHDAVSEFESQIYRRDGSVIWISENARAVRDDMGKLLYYEGFVEDITQRKHAEEALRESEERLRLVIEGVKDYAIFMLDTNGYVASWNAGAASILGYAADDIIGHHYSCFYTREDLEMGKPTRHLSSAAALGRVEEEGWRVRQNGSRFWGHIITTALYDDNGQLRGFSKVTRDITERQQAAAVQARLIASLQASEKKFRSLYESTTDAVILMDETGFLDCNRATLELFGCQNKLEFVNCTVAQLSPPLQPNGEDSGIQAQQILTQAFQVGSCRFDWRHRRLDGSEFPAEVLLTVMEIDEGKQGIQAVVRDITSRVQAQEALEQANEELESRVQERTSQLEAAIKQLQGEIVERQRAEEALRESQRALSTLMSNLPGMAYRFSNDECRRMEFVSEGCYQLTGYLADEFLADQKISLSSLTHPDDQEGLWNAVQTALQENRPYQLIYRITSKTGELKWVWEQGMGIFSDAGELLALEGLITDITEQKRAEEAFRESQRTLSNLMSNLPGMAYRCRYDETRTMEFVSEGCYHLTGYHPDELILNQAVTFSQLIAADDQLLVKKTVERALQEKRSYQIQYRILSNTGTTKWVWEQGLGVFSETGELLALEGLITDITQRKQIEDELRHSQQELQTQKTQLERTLQELQQTQATLIHTEKMSTLGQMVAGVAHEINNPVSCVCGNLVHLSRYTKDLIDLLHIYEKYYPEPIREIKDLIEEIELEFLVEDLPKVIFAMETGADRIREIVRSLRNFSRTDEAQMSFINIHEGIEGTLLILQNRLKPRGDYPGIVVHKQYSNLPLVECYVGRMNQVFMNLIGNAIDALDEYNEKRTPAEIKANPSRIIIRTEFKIVQAADTETEFIVIRISDNGPGITEEVRQRLFDPFFTTKPVGKGTGLGLSISYQIVVEKHKGQLNCISAPGQGAEFVIEIPVKQVD